MANLLALEVNDEIRIFSLGRTVCFVDAGGFWESDGEYSNNRTETNGSERKV